MKRSNLSAGIYLLLVFLSGALVGAFAHRLYMVNSVISSTARKSPEEYRRKYVEEMKSRLALNRDQVAKLQAVLDQTRSCYDQLHEQSKPAMKAIHDDQRAKIRSFLDENQKAEYAKMQAEREKRRQQMQQKPPNW